MMATHQSSRGTGSVSITIDDPELAAIGAQIEQQFLRVCFESDQPTFSITEVQHRVRELFQRAYGKV